MGIFDFLKKKKQESEKLDFSKINDFIETRKYHINKKNNELSISIREKIESLIKTIENQLTIVSKIDLKEKKVEERIKFIVRENLVKYISQVERLKDELNEINSNYPKIIEDINKIFYEFDKRSHLNYEKATFLIGKELESIKNSISEFFERITLILRDNNQFIEESKIIDIIEKNVKEISKIKYLKIDIEKTISSLKRNKSEIQESSTNIETEISKIIRSNEYKEELESIKQVEANQQEIEKELLQLKESIDFKKMSAVFHSNPKKMNQINEFKMNFIESFEQESPALMNLLNDSGLNNSFLTQRINQIIKRYREIEKTPEFNVSNRLKELQSELRDIEIKLINLDEEISREERKIEKLDETKTNLEQSTKDELLKINIELI